MLGKFVFVSRRTEANSLRDAIAGEVFEAFASGYAWPRDAEADDLADFGKVAGDLLKKYVVVERLPRLELPDFGECGAETFGTLMTCMRHAYFATAEMPGEPANDAAMELVKRGFFDKNMFHTFGILTSQGIQKRYINATTNRSEVEIIADYRLIPTPENTKRTTFRIMRQQNPKSGRKCGIKVRKGKHIKECRCIACVRTRARAGDGTTAGSASPVCVGTSGVFGNRDCAGLSGAIPRLLRAVERDEF